MTAALVQATHWVDECFGGKCDERVMDGLEPELSPGWAHRRKSTYPEVRYAAILNVLHTALSL